MSQALSQLLRPALHLSKTISAKADPFQTSRKLAAKGVKSARVNIWLEERKNGLTVRHVRLFRDPASEQSRLFLSRIFSVEEIETVEIDRVRGIGRLHYQAAANVGEILRKLQRAMETSLAGKSRAQGPKIAEAVARLFLQNPAPAPIRVARVGDGLSTWQVEQQAQGLVRLSHPILRQRKDVLYRLEEELASVQGVWDYKKRGPFSSSIVVRYNPRQLEVPRLLRHLEYCWPRLINGLEGPPPKARFFASSSLLTFAFTGQYVLPVLTPFVLVGLAVYSFPNVVNGIKLLRRGKVGLPVLYTGTLTFTVLSGQPFAATLMATLMQLWPLWAHHKLTKSQRQLFATYRQRATWARREEPDGRKVEVNLDQVNLGDVIVIYEAEIIPVDGVILEGLAAVDEEALTGRSGAFDKAPGDPVLAATFIRKGQIKIRVTHLGLNTMAGFIGQQLPHGKFRNLPESAEAEAVATKMVTPALALSGLNLLVTGEMQPSQSTIRPDYATGPRLSAQLAALHDLSDALRRGIVFRDPAALSRLPATDIYVFDDSRALERRRIAVEEIFTARGVEAKTVLSYATSAFPAYQNNRARALLERCLDEGAPLLNMTKRSRGAGVIRYHDEHDAQIEVATLAYLKDKNIKVPAALGAAFHASASAWAPVTIQGGSKKKVPHPEPQVRPLWVLRDGAVLGVVTFQRSGELEAIEVIATLKARNAQARFVHISQRPQKQAESIAWAVGIATVYGGLDTNGKVEILRKLGRRTLWIGEGSSVQAKEVMAVSPIRISVAGAATVPLDGADIILLQPSLVGLVPLRRIGRRHRALLKEGYKWVFTANLFCVGGAFFGGFTTLAVALTSNVATGYVYETHRRLLNDLIQRMEAKMAKAVVSDAEEHDPSEGTSDVGAYEQERHEDLSEPDPDLAMAGTTTRPV